MKLLRKVTSINPAAWSKDTPEIIQQIYANRGITSQADLDKSLSNMLDPMLLSGMDKVSTLLADIIENQRCVTIAGDYDCDGATGTSVAVLGLRMLGLAYEKVRFIIPNRDKHGYGLSPGLVADMPPATEVVLTVDNGVASVEGVRAAKAKGYQVIVTDHHLAGDILPEPDAMVNPNLPNDTFPSKALAGVGVMFYALIATRAELKRRGHPGGQADLTALLDLVAIGTVADLVPLDRNNRILVDAGIRRIRFGRASTGIKALLNSANKAPETFTSTDIAFAIAPRLNAAGRLADMTLGVKLLTCNDIMQATKWALQLEDINNERKEIQSEMVVSAEAIVAELPKSDDVSVVVYDASWHHGVVGLVASKLKESLHRPTIAFAPGGEGSLEARGSARSIPGFHLRDTLALVNSRYPGLIKKFGGHAMAAGLSVNIADIPAFTQAFNGIVRETIDTDALENVIYSDGELEPDQMTLEFNRYLESCGPWGQAFAKPVFDGVFEVKTMRLLSDKHVKFTLYDVRRGDEFEAIWFYGYKGQDIPQRFTAAYELSSNVWRDRETLQLLIRYVTVDPIQETH